MVSNHLPCHSKYHQIGGVAESGRFALKIGRRLTSKIVGRWDWQEVGGGIGRKWEVGLAGSGRWDWQEVGGGIGRKWDVGLAGSGRWTVKNYGTCEIDSKNRWEIRG